MPCLLLSCGLLPQVPEASGAKGWSRTDSSQTIRLQGLLQQQHLLLLSQGALGVAAPPPKHLPWWAGGALVQLQLHQLRRLVAWLHWQTHRPRPHPDRVPRAQPPHPPATLLCKQTPSGNRWTGRRRAAAASRWCLQPPQPGRLAARLRQQQLLLAQQMPAQQSGSARGLAQCQTHLPATCGAGLAHSSSRRGRQSRCCLKPRSSNSSSRVRWRLQPALQQLQHQQVVQAPGQVLGLTSCGRL
jgi:hypothetical protein